jgi:hypothetical protein
MTNHVPGSFFIFFLFFSFFLCCRHSFENWHPKRSRKPMSFIFSEIPAYALFTCVCHTARRASLTEHFSSENTRESHRERSAPSLFSPSLPTACNRRRQGRRRSVRDNRVLLTP